MPAALHRLEPTQVFAESSLQVLAGIWYEPLSNVVYLSDRALPRSGVVILNTLKYQEGLCEKVENLINQ